MIARARPLRLAPIAAVALFAAATAQDLSRGSLIDSVTVSDDPAQSYALYLPSDYTRERVWSLLLAFHPSARGAAFVEKYRAAAERYGYIVAGSNNSRNGSWDETIRAVRAMSRDVGRRFAVDAERVYLTGLSGGARVAMEVALGPNRIAGVIASSAGFPDAKPRSSGPFPIFATVGVEDFNYLEMMRLDARLQSPHYLAVFDGGHSLPPDSLAMEAVEWLELEAMRSRRRETDTALVHALVASRQARLQAATARPVRLRLLRAMAADFAGLHDVSAFKAEADRLAADPQVKDALERERADLETETRLLNEGLEQESRLRDPASRPAALARLRALFEAWSLRASGEEPSLDRARARRLLGAIAAGAGERAGDEEYRALVQQYRRR
jgi:pimeloyl-ACP methyl ester carboxylesterase